jgi:rubrerythrin
MVEFESSKTKVNLARAFAGECQDGAKYQFLAKLALEEGYPYMQSIFKTHAKNEMAHAERYYNLINEYNNGSPMNIEICGGYTFSDGTLLELIKDTIDVEKSQSDVVYQKFADIAKEEGYDEIAKAFLYTATVENCHKLMLEQIYNKLKKDKLYKSSKATKWKCSKCGFEHTSREAWEICPSCHAEQGYVEIQIDMNSGD